MEFFVFSYFSEALAKEVVQVNLFVNLEEALKYAQTCGSNAKAVLWNHDNSVYETGIL